MRIISLTLLASAVALPLAVMAYKEGAPANMTGGFGEPSCHSCHLDNPLNAPGGSLKVSGVPPEYAAGRQYRITIDLVREGTERAGFQIAARFASGKQAGSWRVLDERAQLKPSEKDPNLTFVEQTSKGSATAKPGTNTWTIEWTAPPSPAGPIDFHAAANAANDDASALGDFIYLATKRSDPAK